MSALSANVPRFIAFRVLFNARFYYPVLGVLFVDLGLTVAEYALLNVAWAVAILTLEVPSGALADVIGRKRMVVLAAGLMVVEMAVFAFAPVGPWLFPILLLNRILSGAAEASASGADEALTYDSLDPATREQAWPGVLARLMRWQSAAFVGAMLVGAAVFDPALVRSVTAPLGWTPETVTRWPVYLTLGTAIACLVVALGFREAHRPAPAHFTAAARLAWGNIAAGARWIGSERRILLIILAGLVADSFTRLFLTLASNYFRLIDLPPASYGALGAAMGMLGFVAAPLASHLVARRGAAANFSLAGAGVFVGLLGASFAPPIWGLWVMVPLGIAMNFTGFFLSHYLNAWVPSATRATVLSFRGVALNLGYGGLGLAFAALSARLDRGDADATLAAALVYLPPAFGVAAAAVALLALRARRTR